MPFSFMCVRKTSITFGYQSSKGLRLGVCQGSTTQDFSDIIHGGTVQSDAATVQQGDAQAWLLVLEVIICVRIFFYW